MIKQNQRLLNAILITTDALVVVLAFIAAWFLRFKTTIFGPLGGFLPFENYLLLALFIIPLYLIFYYFSGLYKPFRNQSNIISEATEIFKVNLMAFIILIALLFIIDEPNYSRKLIFVFASFSTVFAIIERAIFRSILKHIRSNDKTLNIF
nr:hypothetical protein [Methanobrevibacter arboriphilus]